MERVRWAWQQLELLWDQRLLTFGLGEQIDLVDGAIELLHRIPELLHRPSVVRAAVVVAAIVAFSVLLRLWWKRRFLPWRPQKRSAVGPASRAMRRLARALIPVGGVVPPWATVRSIGGQAASFWPQSAAAVDELVERAEDELYGIDGEHNRDAAEIARLWKRIRAGMKSRELTVTAHRQSTVDS
jgi:hypothetical protein